MRMELQLNQASLQDYLDCRRKFYLRHVLKINWPGHQTDQFEQQQHRIRQGVAFHRLVHQHIIGQPDDRLAAIAFETDLDRWWRGYIQNPVVAIDNENHAEISLSAPIAGQRLVAKYDLVSIGPTVLIVDWKTSKRREETWLRGRMQTRVYQYLMVLAGADLHGGIEPERVEMLYWFADNPQNPVRFSYHRRQFEQDDQDLRSLVQEIGSLEENEFELAEDRSRCRFCAFRSLCDRGIAPGAFDEFESDWDAEERVEIDLEQIGEIAF